MFVPIRCFLSIRMARARFSSSLWWRSPPDISSVTFDHDVLFKLPSRLGRRVTYSVDPATACAGPLEVRHPRLGFPLLPQLSAATELLVINLIAHHNP